MSTTVFLCLIAALVSTVSCQTNCTKCENKNGVTCTSEETVTCPYGCVTVSEYCNIQNRPVPSIKMDCAPQGFTQFLAFALNDAGSVMVQVHMAQCNGDQCNKDLPYRYDPADIGQPNGLYCQSCFLENSRKLECKSCDRVACRGGQRKCLSASGTYKRGNGVIADYVASGCVNDEVCALGFGVLFATNVLKERTFKCTDASTSARDCSGCGGNLYY